MKLTSGGEVFQVMIIENVQIKGRRKRGMNKVTHDRVRGRLYWGAMPLPHEGEIIGTVTRRTGEAGALIKMPGGVLVQGNAGAVRMISLQRGGNHGR